MKYRVGDIVDYKLFKKSENVYKAKVVLVNRNEKYYIIEYEDMWGAMVRDLTTDEELEVMFKD